MPKNSHLVRLTLYRSNFVHSVPEQVGQPVYFDAPFTSIWPIVKRLEPVDKAYIDNNSGWFISVSSMPIRTDSTVDLVTWHHWPPARLR